MKILKEMDLTAEEAQLRLVIKRRDEHHARHQEALDALHLMLAKKTLDYYGADGYDAFFERHHLRYTTSDGYKVEVEGHDMSVSIQTPWGVIDGSGSTWDYIQHDLKLSAKPMGMEKRDYSAIKKRMEEIQNSERVLYPFHPLHRIGNGYFDTRLCMYNAHKLVNTRNNKENDDEN